MCFGYNNIFHFLCGCVLLRTEPHHPWEDLPGVVHHDSSWCSWNECMSRQPVRGARSDLNRCSYRASCVHGFTQTWPWPRCLVFSAQNTYVYGNVYIRCCVQVWHMYVAVCILILYIYMYIQNHMYLTCPIVLPCVRPMCARMHTHTRTYRYDRHV